MVRETAAIGHGFPGKRTWAARARHMGATVAGPVRRARVAGTEPVSCADDVRRVPPAKDRFGATLGSRGVRVAPRPGQIAWIDGPPDAGAQGPPEALCRPGNGALPKVDAAPGPTLMGALSGGAKVPVPPDPVQWRTDAVHPGTVSTWGRKERVPRGARLRNVP